MNNNISEISEIQPSMNLQQLLALSDDKNNNTKEVNLTEEHILELLPQIKNLIAFFREYPDIFIDFIKQTDPDCHFEFYYYQRIFVRIVMRHRYVYATFPRA